MSERMNDGGPAFPHLHNTCQRLGESEMFPGMSLRDWFAGQALAGAMADARGLWDLEDDGDPDTFNWAARRAYLFADAMLAARGGGE